MPKRKFTPRPSDAPPTRNNDDLFDGQLTRADLVSAVHVWSYCRSDFTSVGDAALAFGVTPQFMADAIDKAANPAFRALPGKVAAIRTLICAPL